jgi:hypothetical protein
VHIENGAISAAKIEANTITASQIAAGTITATEIATGTITANKMNVSSLSAINANLGTVTAGTITGVSITGSTFSVASSAVLLDSNGLSLTAGSGGTNSVKWSDGSVMYSVANDIFLISSSDILLVNGGGSLIWDGSKWYPINSGKDLGSASSPWRNAYFSDLAGSGNRTVCSDNNGKLYTVASGGAC